MSEEERAYTSTLLPSATIELFSRDEDTVKTLQSLQEDWRFARVSVSIHDGDVETATARYAETASPDLMIIQTETIEDGLADQLAALAGNCSEGTAAIIIGPVNDVNLYRKLVGMGVSDYLVKPLQKEAFVENIAATLIEKMGESGSTLVAMIGAKGGVGTSALAQMMAWGVSEQLAQKTFLLDAAGGWSTMPVGMDFEPITTLGEAGRAADEENTESLDRMFLKKNNKLTVLGSGGDVMLEDTVDADKYETLLSHLMVTYPVVIVDLSQSPSALKKTVLSRAHKILVVTTPLLASVRSARSLAQEIKTLRGGDDKHLNVIVNMQGIAAKYEVPKKQVEQGLNKAPAATIAYDQDLFVGTESRGKKITEEKAADKIISSLLHSLSDVLQGAAKETRASTDQAKSGGLGGFISKLKSKS